MKRATVMLGLLLALTGVFAGTAHAADATPAAAERLQALDAAILTQLNATRAAHGLRPLAVSDQLESAAVAHSRAMIDGGFFAHDSPGGASFVQRLKRFYKPAGYSSWSAGENIVYSSAALDAAEAIRVWMHSPPHRENMLDPTWREVGIGSLHAASAGGTFGGDPTWVITMDFGVRTGGATARKAAAAVKAVTVHKAVARNAKRPAAKPTSKRPFTPPVKPTKARPVHEAEPKPAPMPSAPSIPVPSIPDPGASDDGFDAALRHHHGDDGLDEGVDPGSPDPGSPDPGTADPGAPPADPPPAP